MLMQTCPKCAYTRKATDTAPDWQCPSCRTAYAKSAADLAAVRRAERLAQQPIEPPEKPRRQVPWPILIRVTGATVFAGALAYGAYGKFVLKPAAAPRVAAAQAASQQPVATLFSTTSCPDCRAVRDLLDRRGVKYIEVDVEKQPERQQQLNERYNVSSFPVLQVGEEIVIGFQPLEIERVIGKHI